MVRYNYQCKGGGAGRLCVNSGKLCLHPPPPPNAKDSEAEGDTQELNMRLPQRKLVKLRELVRVWRRKKFYTKRELQSLAGHLDVDSPPILYIYQGVGD